MYGDLSASCPAFPLPEAPPTPEGFLFTLADASLLLLLLLELESDAERVEGVSGGEVPGDLKRERKEEGRRGRGGRGEKREKEERRGKGREGMHV